VPPRVRELADDVFGQLEGLAAPRGDEPAAYPRLDAARDAYRELYGEAEALAYSSIGAARRKAKAALPPAPPSLRVRVARRIPKRHRVRLRRVLGALRPRS
jgi:hypothetical protein